MTLTDESEMVAVGCGPTATTAPRTATDPATVAVAWRSLARAHEEPVPDDEVAEIERRAEYFALELRRKGRLARLAVVAWGAFLAIIVAALLGGCAQ